MQKGRSYGKQEGKCHVRGALHLSYAKNQGDSFLCTSAPTARGQTIARFIPAKPKPKHDVHILATPRLNFRETNPVPNQCRMQSESPEQMKKQSSCDKGAHRDKKGQDNETNCTELLGTKPLPIRKACTLAAREPIKTLQYIRKM